MADRTAAAHPASPSFCSSAICPLWHRDALVTDDAEGGRAVMDHLLGLGHRAHRAHHRRHLSQPRLPIARIGVPAALAAAGLAVEETFLRDGNYSFEGAYGATRSLLSLDDPPTAFFCISDRMALGCLSAIQDSGRRVPEDVSLVGYDNLELLNYVRPRLTTVDHGGRESGRRLALRLLERIKNPELAPEVLTASPRLLPRETTGPAPR